MFPPRPPSKDFCDVSVGTATSAIPWGGGMQIRRGEKVRRLNARCALQPALAGFAAGLLTGRLAPFFRAGHCFRGPCAMLPTLLRYACSTLFCPESCIILHNPASLGCGSHCLRGDDENPACLGSGSHCLRRMPCILENCFGRVARKWWNGNGLGRGFICRNNNGV